MQQNHPLTPKLKLMQLEPNVLNIIIPTPGKKMSGQKCRKKQETRHDNSDVYFKQTLAKRKLKVEKEGNAKSIPKKRNNTELLTSRASFQTFTKRVMKTRHVGAVA
jgi:hypothetical protein